ncbi:MAG: DUF547 domain-containing protein [Mariprofundaceae bacterium]
MFRISIGVLAVALMFWTTPSQAFDHSHGLWNQDLKKYNESGFVHYGAWSRSRANLDRYITTLKSVKNRNMSGWTTAQTHAFWLNTYNALVVSVILDHYPFKLGSRTVSIRGMYGEKQWAIAGQELTLNDIRDHILRKTRTRTPLLSDLAGQDNAMKSGQDLRFLLAINDGTISSALLRAEAYTSESLNRQLEDQARKTVNDPQFAQVVVKQKAFKLGYVFKQFKKDFDQYGRYPAMFSRSSRYDRGVQRFVYHYLPESIQDQIIARQKSPWRINFTLRNPVLNGGD